MASSALKSLFLPGKIFGLASFRFQKNECGTSRIHSAYSVFVILSLTLLVVATSIWNPITTLYEEGQGNVIEEAVDNLEAYVSSFTMVACVAFHFSRRNKLCVTLNKIQAFDHLLEHDNVTIDYKMADRYVILGVIFVYTLDVVYVFLEIISFIDEETVLQMINYATPALVISYVDFQFCALVLLVRQRFAAINTYYEEHGDHWNILEHKEFNSDNFKGRTPKKLYSPEKYIYENLQKRTEYIRRRHYELCEIAKEINELYSPQLLFILMQSLITLISIVFFLASSFISSTTAPLYMNVYTTCLCSFCALQIIVIIVVCILVTNESQKTARMMFKKEYHLLRFKEFEHEIYFSVQLMHQKVHLEACKGLPITGPMLSTIIGTIITYLLIVIQFDINMNKINLHLSNNNTKL